MTICVFGSLNMDLVLKTFRLPMPGETVEGYDFIAAPGGKGANQAIAIQKLGQAVEMVGRVGDDPYGLQLIQHLQDCGVGTDGIKVDLNAPSGIAMITASESGDNQIVLASGANAKLTQADLDSLKPLLTDADMLLLQMEVPLQVVMAAARMAKEAGVRVVLDPAPAPSSLPAEMYDLVDILTPNQTEASRLAGFGISTPADAMQAANVLQSRGATDVVVTMGNQGAFCATTDTTLHIPIYEVPVVDSIAAGDSFNAAMAVALVEGHSFYESLMWGSAAGAMTVSRRGTEAALPSRAELDEFMSTHVAEDSTYH